MEREAKRILSGGETCLRLARWVSLTAFPAGSIGVLDICLIDNWQEAVPWRLVAADQEGEAP